MHQRRRNTDTTAIGRTDMPTSQNGWSANDRSKTRRWQIPGTSREVTLRKGVTGWLLCDFAAWFDDHIESVDGGIYDDWGYAERPIRGSSTTLSNHASGTALDLNATKHPLGVRNTFSRTEDRKIRAKLRDYDGCIRWGGDYSGRPDEMHFEIDRGQAACVAAQKKLQAGGDDVSEKDVIDALHKAIVKNKGTGKDRSVVFMLSNMEDDQDRLNGRVHDVEKKLDRILDKLEK